MRVDERSCFKYLKVHTKFSLQILGRTIRVDHCEQYNAPNADMSKVDEVTAAIRMEGCAPQLIPRTETVVKEVIKEVIKENE